MFFASNAMCRATVGTRVLCQSLLFAVDLTLSSTLAKAERARATMFCIPIVVRRSMAVWCGLHRTSGSVQLGTCERW